MKTRPAELVPALGQSMNALAALLNRAFEGYAIELRETGRDFVRRVASDSIDLSLSRLAETAEGDPAGLCLVGARRGTWRVAAMGVVRECRRQGFGTALMENVIDDAGAAGARRLILEVIEGNRPARALYDALGFRPARRLVGFTLDDTGRAPSANASLACALEETDHRDVARALEENGPADLPWQMQPASIAALGPPCQAFSLEDRAWVLLRELDDGVMSLRVLAIAEPFQGRGLGRQIFESLRARYPRRRWRIAPRVPEGLADGFFLRMGFERMPLVQVEMERVL